MFFFLLLINKTSLPTHTGRRFNLAEKYINLFPIRLKKARSWVPASNCVCISCARFPVSVSLYECSLIPNYCLRQYIYRNKETQILLFPHAVALSEYSRYMIPSVLVKAYSYSLLLVFVLKAWASVLIFSEIIMTCVCVHRLNFYTMQLLFCALNSTRTIWYCFSHLLCAVVCQ